MSWPAERTLVTLSVLALSACAADGRDPAGGQHATVFIDGLFDEWADTEPLIEDPRDAPEAAVDLGSIHVRHDEAWLYLAVDVGREVNAQSLPGSILFLLDTDPTAGGEVHGVPGVDLILDLSHVDDPESGQRGQGFALRSVDERGPGTPTDAYALDVVVAPTWSATRFEMRVGRGGSPDPVLRTISGPLRIGAVYVEGGTIFDRTAVAEYDVTATTERYGGGLSDEAPQVEGRPTAEEQLARRTGATRVAQWNVSGRSFDRQPAEFARAFAAVNADVLLLDELSGDIEESDLRDFFEQESLRALGSWTFVLGTSGGRQRAAVATRSGSIRAAAAATDIRYAQGAIDAIAASAPETYHAALGREEAGGLSAVAAWIPIAGREVLFAAVDLQSQGWIGSVFDRLRTLQAETLRAHLLREIDTYDGAGVPPVVIGGDLNMVGSRAPMEALTDGLDPDGESLEAARAERIGERTLSTWGSRGAPFAPGRLDFLLVPRSAVALENAFVFATQDLTPESLARLGLERETSEQLSDHLIVVADFRLR